jgi:uncharacterized membrane protein
MIEFIKYFLLATLIFCVLDFIWLSRVAKSFYDQQIGIFLSKKPNVTAAVIFYSLFIVGLIYFVINPAINETKSVTDALIRGGLYGLFTYGTYDLTNLATVKNWPWKLTVVDMIWGVVLSTSVAGLTTLILL